MSSRIRQIPQHLMTKSTYNVLYCNVLLKQGGFPDELEGQGGKGGKGVVAQVLGMVAQGGGVRT